MTLLLAFLQALRRGFAHSLKPVLLSGLTGLRGLSAITCLTVLAGTATPARAQSVQLEVACFRGGYGIDFYEKCAREFESAHPGVKINLWGSPRVWDQLTPRFASGTPPDLCLPGWGMNVFSLIFDGQLTPLDPFLQKPASGSSTAWADTIMPSMLRKGSYQGRFYTIPYNFDTFGWWYNRKMFREHGWKAPATYEELLTLCEAIKKEHIAPVTFAGRYPQYMLDGMFLPWSHSAGGQEMLDRVDHLEPGAWKTPGFLKAAQTLMDMKTRGYFQAGCIGMNHTESQMEFLVGRAAMVPNGTWLYSEMKQLMPPDFEMEFMLCPVFEKGIGDPTAIKGTYDGKGWCIPAKSKHPEVAAEFLRYLTSAEVGQQFMQRKGTLTAIRTVSDAHMPVHLREPMRIIREARSEWNVDYAEWYPELGSLVQNAIRDLYNEVLTPEQFLDRIEKAATALRNDPHRRKFGAQ